ncbi:Major facilitator superfamily domain-containing protein 10 [Hypsibius exemplaris]|uniref:Major facilitator superfamily domain-containing protein 10 n=1 Tax=Hypsibius exemplaris TaxID=2072580 RepID=A0A9X6NCC9_HYPEX|nr:Major facilitator superfamily domain-containing protein 10 [Hypsibius exemplaris]
MTVEEDSPKAANRRKKVGFAESPLSPTPSADSETKRVYGIVFVILLVDLLAFTCILPLFPALFDYYGSHGEKDSTYSALQNFVTRIQLSLGIAPSPKSNSVLFGGILGSLFSFLQFVASPIVGALSDVYGRKPILVITTIGIAISYLVWSFSTTFTLFVIARIIGGISKGNISLGTAIVTDVSTPGTRGKGMAMVGIAFSLGFIIGPMIGAGFAAYSRRNGVVDIFLYPALFSLLLQILDLLLVVKFLPETLATTKRAKSVVQNLKESLNFIDPRRLVEFAAVKGLAAADRVHIRRVGMAYFLYLFFFSGLEFTLTFLMHSRFQYDSEQQGKMFLFIGIIMILVQGGFVRRMAPGREKRTALMGFGLTIPGFIIIALAGTQALVFLGLALYSTGSAVVAPCLSTLVANYGRDDQKGTVLGIFRSLGALARAFGPLFSSVLYWSFGPTVSYFIGGLMILFPLMILKR